MNLPRLGARALLLASALLPCACHRSSRAEDGTRAGILQFANEAEPQDLDPNTNISGSDDRILTALFEGLVSIGKDGRSVQPGVAESWDVSPDGLRYTFHLRAGARWSNGEPMTAADFLFTFRRVFDPQLACEESSFGFAVAGSEDYALGRVADPATLGVDAPDPRTFVIRLGHPAAYFLSLLASSPFLPVYRPALEKFGGVRQRGAPWTREGNLVSNGPFQLARWVPNQVIEVRPNPHYWDAAHVALKGIDFYPVDDGNVQELGFRSGQFHIATRVPALKALTYAQRPGVLRRVLRLGSVFVTFNVAQAPFTDPRVRQALSMALDRERLCASVYHGLAQPAHTQVVPGAGGYTPPTAATDRLDPEGARRLLAAAGYPGGRGFPVFDLMLVGSDATTVNTGEVLQEAWRSVLGVTVHLAPTEPKVYLDAERTKHYQAIVDNWDLTWDDPSAFYQTGQTGNPNNDSGWSDAEFDRAYRAAELSPDPDIRRRAFDVQEARLAAGTPYAPLLFRERVTLVLPDVQGWNTAGIERIDWKGISLGP